MLGKLLAKFPELSKSGDHIRAGMSATLGLALTIGAFLAANATWGVVGIMIVGGFYALNEMTGNRLPKTAVGPFGAVVVGIVYNIVLFLGLLG